MALSLREILPPCVESMAAKKEAVDGRLRLKHCLNLFRELTNVLPILEDGEDFPMLMGVDAPQTLEHLIAFEHNGAIGCINIREQGLQRECVCSTAPALRARTMARCNPVSAEGRPVPRTTFADSSISRS